MAVDIQHVNMPIQKVVTSKQANNLYIHMVTDNAALPENKMLWPVTTDEDHTHLDDVVSVCCASTI